MLTTTIACSTVLVLWADLVLRGFAAAKQTSEHVEQDGKDFEIVYPVAWDRDDHIPLHTLQAAWRQNRRKRSTFSINVNVTGFGDIFHLELWVNQDLLAPGFRIYHRQHLHNQQPRQKNNGGNVGDQTDAEPEESNPGVRVGTQEEVDRALACQLAGSVRSHGDTPVAISICDGIKGVIRTVGEDYIIEPVVDHEIPDLNGSYEDHPDRVYHPPHKLYKRSALLTRHQNQFCGTGRPDTSSHWQKRSGTATLVRQQVKSTQASGVTDGDAEARDTNGNRNSKVQMPSKQRTHRHLGDKVPSLADQLTNFLNLNLHAGHGGDQEEEYGNDKWDLWRAALGPNITKEGMQNRESDLEPYIAEGELDLGPSKIVARMRNIIQNDGFHSAYNAKNDGNSTVLSRGRRSLTRWKYLQNSNEKTMEMLVVVDKTMIDRHGNQNVTTYTLTLFNMVSKLFEDVSLGSRIHVVLVGLVLLEGDEPGLSVTHHADKTLNSFCSWQSVLLGANGRQHDHAVLLSATDFCSYKDSPCDTLGFAPIGGMCNQIRSCTINEDTGLNTALTIAHEIGHNFGMFHDGEGNYCRQTVGSIMAPTLVSKDGTLQWSVCSRAYLLRFLNTPQSECLDNKSQHVAELRFPDQLPGQLYNADIQCKWQFGDNARLCTYDFGKDTCKALWCYRGNKRCETKFLPAAEGTSCGLGMWCRDGKCIQFGSDGPEPIHGGWSEWGEWSACTRTCGKGVQARERECNRPLPQYGGNACSGSLKQHRLCNTQDCQVNSELDSHSIQCAEYDKKPFRGWYMHWKPYKKLYDAGDPCKLYCLAETLSYIFTIKHLAVDGTSCAEKDGSICIDGSCQKIGCDSIVNSSATTDVCGICKGDNSTCQLITGQFSQQPSLNTYYPIVVLPKGAQNVKIQEKSISSNYLAIRNIYGHYYLNGERRVAWPGIYSLGGASFQYKRPYNEPETLDSAGPLKEDIILEILVQDTNPGVLYQYTIPHNDKKTLPATNNYTWSISASACSQSCAGGKKMTSLTCVKNQAIEVDKHHCNASTKPYVGLLACNSQPCPVRWATTDWSECSATCDQGKQVRKVQCRQQMSQHKDRKLSKQMCKHLPKPDTHQQCNNEACLHQWQPRWVPGEWSTCSKSCGGGRQTRKVLCRKRQSKTADQIVSKHICRHLPKPHRQYQCNMHECPPDWHAGRWSKCSVSCGEGSQIRKVTCRRGSLQFPQMLDDEACNLTSRPPTSRICQRYSCRSHVVWRYSTWGLCSVTCGNGKRERTVWCSDGHSQQNPDRCIHLAQPPASEVCSTPACPDPQPSRRMAGPFCEDKEQWCHLVRQHRACGHTYYRQSCCRTCLGA